MKLATALAERSDIQNRINTISVRLDNNAKVQEGDVPVSEIQKTVDGLAKELRTVDEKIQELNWTTELV